MVQKDTMYIVTSSQVSSIKKILREKLSLLFGNFETIIVSDFDYQKSCEFVNSKLGDNEISRELSNFLISFTNGRPFYLDIVASRLKDAVNMSQCARLDQSVISEVFQDLFFDTKGTLNQYFQNLMSIFLDRPHTSVYMDIMIAISDGKNRLSDVESRFSGKKGSIRKRIDELIEACIITKNGTRLYFNDKVLEFWVKFVYCRKKYSLVTSVVDSANLFRKDVEVLISNFISVDRMSICDRLKEVISSFDNEIIHLGEKRVRMPRFKKIELTDFPDKTDVYVNASYGADKLWAFQVNSSDLNENRLASYIEKLKGLDPQPKCKVLVNFSQIDENSMLLAKQNKIWLWDKETINLILLLYRKQKVL